MNGNGLLLAGAGGHLIKIVNLCTSISIWKTRVDVSGSQEHQWFEFENRIFCIVSFVFSTWRESLAYSGACCDSLSLGLHQQSSICINIISVNRRSAPSIQPLNRLFPRKSVSLSSPIVTPYRIISFSFNLFRITAPLLGRIRRGKSINSNFIWSFFLIFLNRVGSTAAMASNR